MLYKEKVRAFLWEDGGEYLAADIDEATTLTKHVGVNFSSKVLILA
jgi:hypothetical protein